MGASTIGTRRRAFQSRAPLSARGFAGGAFDADPARGCAADVPRPRVTLVIPCRDAGRHLRALLESLLAQTESDTRLLLVDDASTDGSVALAREVAGGRLEIHRNEVPLGIGGNWNRCAELVATPYFCLAHQDDVYAPTFVQRMAEALEAAPDAGLAHCRATAIDDAGAPFHSHAERYKEHFWRHPVKGDRAAQYRRLWRGNFVCCPSVVYRTAAFRRAGPFRTDLSFALDWEYWFRMLAAGFALVDVDEVLLQYRRHETAATRAATREHWRFAEETEVLHAAGVAGVAAGLLPASRAASPALRNILLQEALTDLERGDREAVARKLDYARDQAPELWRDPFVRLFRALRRLGVPGRWLLGVGRDLAVRYGFGGAT